MTERRYLHKSELRLNIIPMIDVMMFMLVFFVLIALRSIPDKGLPFDLPHATAATRLQQHKLIVNLAPDGRIDVDGHTLTLSQLRTRLHARVANGATHVVIAGARSVSLQTLVHTLSAIRAAGVRNVGVAVRTAATH